MRNVKVPFTEQDFAQYKGMVCKLAWAYWRRLPLSVKAWVEPDDLIEDAYLSLLEMARAGKFNPRRGCRTTFLWTGISNLFLNFALSQQTKKRFGWSVPIDDLIPVGVKDKGVVRVDSVDAVLRCYQQASPECRAEMQMWFGYEKIKVRRSVSAQKVYQEFRILADRNRLSPNDCRQLMRAGLCLR